MVDPIFTYIGGIAFLVLIIGSMLYLTFASTDVEAGDEHPGESVVEGVGQEEDEDRVGGAEAGGDDADDEDA